MNKFRIISIFVLLLLAVSACACSDSSAWEEAPQIHEYEFHTPHIPAEEIEEILRLEVTQLLLEDLLVLYDDMRVNITALANAVYRRSEAQVGFGVNVWDIMDRIIDDFQAGTPRFGEGVTDFDDMLIAGSSHMVNRLNAIGFSTQGLIHFGASTKSFVDGFGFETEPHPVIVRSLTAGQSISSIDPLLNPRHGTSISLVEGEVAYLRIEYASFDVEIEKNRLVSFYENIQNYDHLIIDIRNHQGGNYFHFMDTVMKPLLSTPIHIVYYQFLAEGGHFDWMLENIDEIRETVSDVHSHTMETWVYDASTFIYDNNMIHFNKSDSKYLSHALKVQHTIYPSYTNFPFKGKIWLLIDNANSAGVAAVVHATSSGFATTVGSSTGGITHSERAFMVLPNSGINVQVDIGYITDGYGRSVTEFGLPPQIPSNLGMNALETVLAIIEEGS